MLCHCIFTVKFYLRTTFLAVLLILQLLKADAQIISNSVTVFHLHWGFSTSHESMKKSNFGGKIKTLRFLRHLIQGNSYLCHSAYSDHASRHVKPQLQCLQHMEARDQLTSPTGFQFHREITESHLCKYIVWYKRLCSPLREGDIFILTASLLQKGNVDTNTYLINNEKVKCTLVQALRLCTGRTAHRGSRGIALLYRHWGSVQAVRPIGGVEV